LFVGERNRNSDFPNRGSASLEHPLDFTVNHSIIYEKRCGNSTHKRCYGPQTLQYSALSGSLARVRRHVTRVFVDEYCKREGIGGKAHWEITAV
jgi:hypothetical protein